MNFVLGIKVSINVEIFVNLLKNKRKTVFFFKSKKLKVVW